MKSIINIGTIFLALLVATTYCGHATTLEFQPAFPHVSDIYIPVDMDYQIDNNIYVTSLIGEVFRFPNVDSTTAVTVFLNMSNSGLDFYTNGFLGGDEGLLAIEFHPFFLLPLIAVNKVYVTYTPTPTTLAIVAFNVNVAEGVVDTTSAEVLFNIPRPAHKVKGFITEAYLGGDLRFHLQSEDEDDSDCLLDCSPNLFITVGYCNDDNVATNPTSPYLGKVLRITPGANGGFTVPASNPRVNGVRSAIYASGFRNPRKAYFSLFNPLLFVADVGDAIDEINVVTKGKNYGWNIVEGCTSSSVYANPIYDYTSTNPHAITGGPYYLAGSIDLVNRMLFADLYSGTLYSIPASSVGNVQCGNIATPVATAPALVSSILIVGNDVLVCNVIGASYGLPIFYRLVEVST